MKVRIIITATLVVSILSSCVVLQEYDKVNINDPDMLMAEKKCTKFEIAYQVYREGASGANGGKSGGGCGCN